MRKQKKLLCIVLSVLMLTLPMMICVNAENTCGNCGENAIWYFDEESDILKIEGKGKMFDYGYGNDNPRPWDTYRKQIKRIEISDEITYIGTAAFAGCVSLESIKADGVKKISSGALEYCVELKEIDFPSVEWIDEYAIVGCVSLKKIKLMKIISISDHAFIDCYSVEEMHLGESLKEFDIINMNSYLNLKKILFWGDNTNVPPHIKIGYTSTNFNPGYSFKDFLSIAKDIFLIAAKEASGELTEVDRERMDFLHDIEWKKTYTDNEGLTKNKDCAVYVIKGSETEKSLQGRGMNIRYIEDLDPCEDCDCFCHASWFFEIIISILNIVMKFIGVETLCACG